MAKANNKKKGSGDFCSAIGCTNSRNKETCKGMSFFCFPCKDEERCQKWVEYAGRDDLKGLTAAEIARKGIRMCSDHFESSQFNVPAERKRLVWNAVPTIFDFPNVSPPNTSKSNVRPEVDSMVQSCDIKTESPTVTSTQKSLVNGMEIEALRKEYQVMCQKFERLKTLARINLDLLFLSINKEDNLEVRVEMNKVKKLVQALLDEEEKCRNELRVTDAWQSYKSSHDSCSVSRYGGDWKNGVVPRGITLRNSNTAEEIVWRYVGRNKDDVLSFPLFENKTTEATVEGFGDGGSEKRQRKCAVSRKPIYVNDKKTDFMSQSIVVDRGCDKNKNLGEISVKFLVPDIVDVKETVEVTISTNQNGRKKVKGHQYVGCGNYDVVNDMFVPTQDLTDITDEECTVLGIDTQNCVGDVRSEEDRNSGSHLPEDDKDGCDDKDEDEIYISDDVLPGISQNKETTDIIEIKDLSEDESKATQTDDLWSLASDDAFVGSLSHLNHFDLSMERGSQPITVDSEDSIIKSIESHRPDKKKDTEIKASEKKMRIKTRNLLEELAIPPSILDSESGMTMTCPLCSKEYKRKCSFLYHLRCHRRLKNGELPQESKNEPLLCTICGKTLKNQATLYGHIKQHKTIDKGEYFKCLVCGKEYLGKKNLQLHMRCVHVSRKFVCDVCGGAYKTKNALTFHQKFVHSKMNREVCQVCDRKFSTRCNLARHMRIHRGVLPFSCSICGKKFRSSDSRNSHEKRHFGKSPHHCSICNPFGDISRGRLCTHQRMIHFVDGTEEMGDNCSLVVVMGRRGVPGKTKKCVRNLKCETCGKLFLHQGNLKRHLFTHTGLKPHECSTCGRVFNTLDALKLHSWTHSRVKQYPCNKCDKGYNDKRNYLSHMKRLHPEHPVSTDIKDVPLISTAVTATTTTTTVHEGRRGVGYQQQLPVSVQIDEMTVL